MNYQMDNHQCSHNQWGSWEVLAQVCVLSMEVLVALWLAVLSLVWEVQMMDQQEVE